MFCSFQCRDLEHHLLNILVGIRCFLIVTCIYKQHYSFYLLYTVILLNLFNISSSSFPQQTSHLQTMTDGSFTSVPIFSFFFLLYFILFRNSNMMLMKSDDNRHPRLVPNLRSKVFNTSSLRIMLVMDF